MGTDVIVALLLLNTILLVAAVGLLLVLHRAMPERGARPSLRWVDENNARQAARMQEPPFTVSGIDVPPPEPPATTPTAQREQESAELQRLDGLLRKRYPNMAPGQRARVAEELFVKSRALLGR